MSGCRIVMMTLILGLCLGLALPDFSSADSSTAVETQESGDHELNVAPVVLDGATLFQVRGTSSFPAEKRAQGIADRIKTLAADPTFAPASLTLDRQENTTLIRAGKTMILTVTDADAALENVDRNLLAQVITAKIDEAIESWRRDRNPQVLQQSALYALGATIVLVLVLWIGFQISRRLRAALEARFLARVRDLHIKSFQIVRADQLWHLVVRLHNFMWTIALLAVLYFYLYDVLSRFPWTRGLARELFAFLLEPLRVLGLGLISFLPKLIFLIALYFFTRFVLKLLHLFFSSVDAGTLELTNFEPEWAFPTYRLVRVAVIAFAVIVAYPYIPGSETEAFKGISIFIGVIFSLGSSSVIGNLIAGYTMIYRRAFRVGDRVKIGEHFGDVEEIRLMVTHLRTPKNEEVVISNANILAGEVINYSTLAKKQGLILHTTVGIGYETPWRQVEAMLMEAAARTPEILLEPRPFILLNGLGDFCVTYELNVYCRQAQGMKRHYADLHRNILDVFNEYNVQIMTPAYEGDPEQPKVVPQDQWYTAPARRPEAQAGSPDAIR